MSKIAVLQQFPTNIRLKTYTLLQGEPFFGFAANNLQPKADILDEFFAQTQAHPGSYEVSGITERIL
ncbi:hypothetical protein GZ77_09415 [Endozoicomonas montiporae]|uniref:Uncharacterized protein n=2 Tax=Endozoicomonas montiporae TaxID=1027273 RepID=A0A081N7X1_9GAMM|nr:hypothetical protein [Endozoicomonas montiporae]AMO55588.1 hypothetical protein EZMO1_1400 [Endozoicomonas montiporae CL-33]KEQ14544.1 hypothetical protein GZ77_09415 [Endozoicomonas montiporae]